MVLPVAYQNETMKEVNMAKYDIKGGIKCVGMAAALWLDSADTHSSRLPPLPGLTHNVYSNNCNKH